MYMYTLKALSHVMHQPLKAMEASDKGDLVGLKDHGRSAIPWLRGVLILSLFFLNDTLKTKMSPHCRTYLGSLHAERLNSERKR